MKTQDLQIDLETLLAPISEQSPAGSSLRYEGTYDKIREARREDDPNLPMGDWETKLKIADFSLVDKLCREALQRKSKDLQIAAWLAEAWLVRYRIRGLASGLSLFAELVERYWENLFPELGEDADPSARVGLVEWLDEVLADRARRAPFADTGEGASFTLLDWDRAGQTPAAEPSSGDAPHTRVTRESLLARVSLGGASPWSTLLRDVEAAKIAASSVDRVVSERVPQAPSLRRLRDVLGQIDHLARDGARVTGEVTPAPQGEEASGESSEGSSGTVGFTAGFGGGGGAISSRAEAYFRLAEAAEYLIRTEPHSPVPYLVKRAVQWGNMSLAELLYELVGSPDDIVTIQRLLGMRGREE